MTLIADGKKRVTLPKPAKPGDAFDCVLQEGRFVLVKLERPEPAKAARGTLRQRKGRHSVLVGGPKLGVAHLKEIINEVFP
jgi:hypothetical protein